MALKAQWSKITDWTLSPDHGPATGARLTISPPNRQEPYHVSLQAAGDQAVGLTGDGRIRTWTQDGTPKQMPFPAQTSGGLHYLQAVADSRWHAALGSDQHIYTWASGQAAPTIINSNQNTRFTSISMNDNRLLAVDQQGRIHAYRVNNADSQDLNPKFTKLATASLPGKVQAVTATASDSQALIVDADGQAWTWDASKTGKVKPERVRQAPGMRTVQAQALNQGFLLQDADGHVRYLTDNTTDSAAVELSEDMKANSISTNKDQATITCKDGRVWAWKPGEAPKRVDDGSQQYMQAASTGSRITAISRQGGIFMWSIDEQGQSGKPARLDTATAPILETASMDSKPLRFNKKEDSWQTDIPARKPGLATILIAGKQDNQPFTRSLKYTVDQPLTRDVEPRSTFTVRFDTGGGSPEPEDQHFSTLNSRVKRPSTDPARKGFQFDGWFIGQVAYDFSKPVTKDLTLTANWTESRNSTWSISPDQGSQLGWESTIITPPDTSRNIRFSQVSGGKDSSYGFSLAVGSDGNAYAWGNNSYGQLGDGTRTTRSTPVMVRTPDRKTYPDLPTDFTYLQVSAGYRHSLAVGSDGNAYAWGYNAQGQLGDGTTTNRTTPVKVSKPADAHADFTYLQVSAGYDHSLAIGNDGYAYAWGNNNYGQLGDGTSTRQYTPVKVRKLEGTPADFTYLQVSAGSSHSLAVGSDGNAYAWGYNAQGQLGDGTTTNRTTPVTVGAPADFTYVQVSAGGDHSLALGSNGYAYAWGCNLFGQLGNNTRGSTVNPVPVRVRDPASPTDTSKGLKATQVSAGLHYSLAVGSNGYAYACGYNGNGQLGDNSSYNSSVPVRVHDPASPTDTSKGLKAVQVSAKGSHSLAVGSDGNAYAWGYNNYGELGNDSIPTGSYSPVPVPVVFNLQRIITGVIFDTSPGTNLKSGDGSSVSVLTPAHQPGTVTVSVDYTLGGAPQTPDTSLRYTYLPAGVLPKAGGEGILLALATGMTGTGGVLASRRHRREQHQLLHASHE
ncbi:RCC1 domain-containing protein [Bifidobacterium sp. 7101]|uniref:RCC1 domain-containing protein n=1 Tax=Bifidobacterium sp. 7101 TaxID=1394175 RepID=UPI0003F725C1